MCLAFSDFDPQVFWPSHFFTALNSERLNSQSEISQLFALSLPLLLIQRVGFDPIVRELTDE